MSSLIPSLSQNFTTEEIIILTNLFKKTNKNKEIV